MSNFKELKKIQFTTDRYEAQTITAIIIKTYSDDPYAYDIIFHDSGRMITGVFKDILLFDFDKKEILDTYDNGGYENCSLTTFENVLDKIKKLK